jgi:phosphoketolase
MDEPKCLTISANLFFRFGQLELHQLLEKISYASLSFWGDLDAIHSNLSLYERIATNWRLLARLQLSLRRYALSSRQPFATWFFATGAFQESPARPLGVWPGSEFCLGSSESPSMRKKNDLNMIYVSGPGHGAPAMIANSYLEGTFSEVYPEKSQDAKEWKSCSARFPFPAK